MNMLGDRAKNSILMGAALWALVKYCKRDDKQINDWCAEYEDSWGTRIKVLIDWRPLPSPSVPHRYSPSSHHRQSPHVLQQQQPPHRRMSELRNSNPPIPGIRPPSRQYDSSYSGRSPNEIRLHNGNNTSRDLSSHPPSQSDGGRGFTGQGKGQGNGGANEQSNERERDTNTRRLVHDPETESTLQNHVNGVGVTNGGDNGGQKGAGGSSDGPQLLPSLKASGLLDSWSPSRVDGGGVQKQVLHGNSHPFPDARSATLGSMPVGLPWLANESR